MLMDDARRDTTMGPRALGSASPQFILEGLTPFWPTYAKIEPGINFVVQVISTTLMVTH